MDFSKLRAAALRDGDDEEAVTVNTRALIDKVLARYSGEWTTLRELIQNAADAQASTVTIKFESLPSPQVPLSNTTDQSEFLKHVLLHHTLRRLVVTNDGLAFGDNDWSRLKRIAEGNPDETKIGAFGVGFYSVFADCEDPFVSSGDEAMAFYWKGNSLFTKRLQLPPEQGNPNTSFVLDYRNTTTPMPNLLSICQFLATSLTFVALQNLELWVDGWKIISLKKKVAPSVPIPIARAVETRSKEGLMNVRSLDRESVQMDATFMNVVGWKPSLSASVSKPGTHDNYGSGASDVPSLRSFFSRLTASSSHSQLKTNAMREETALQNVVLEDLAARTTTNVFLRVTTAYINTSVTPSFAAELERATKKPPPKKTKIAILTSSYDEEAASAKDNPIARGVDIFASVLPSKKPGGRVFIGFPTHQTTGAGIHLSAPSVIPTVERESIDLNARWVVTWNREMLRVAGIAARLAFSSEMADLSTKVKRAAEAAGRGTKVTKDEIERFMPEAMHTLNTFTFRASTPSSQVSQLIEEGFWMAYKQASIEIYSTRGVLPTTKVRLTTEDLSGFVEGIPVVPKALTEIDFVKKLRDFELITEINIADVRQELASKALTKDQLVRFIAWAGRKASTGQFGIDTVRSLFDVAVAMTGDVDGQGDVIALGSITTFVSVAKIPAELPIPPTTIPFQFTKGCSIDDLQSLGWDCLQIVPWLRYLIESNANRPADESLTTSPKFAGHVLQVLSKAWDGLSPQSKEMAILLLSAIPVVPTKLGMKRPGEAFFTSVRLFDDLPTVISYPGVKEKFLAAIGVRKTVDLETIFSRLLAPPGDPKQARSATGTRHMELIKYLASVKDDIPASDMTRLKASQICPAEAGPKGLEPTRGTSRLYRVSELFEPKDTLRELGLPIIQWLGPQGNYKPSSTEGRFLSLLGIRAYPSPPELVELMATGDIHLRNKAMTYFIGSHHINGYASFEIGATAKCFLPLQGDEKRLVSPAECFTNERCAVLGFSILKRELHAHANKFGVALDPPLTECINRIISNPPRNRRDATTLFAYFSSRLGEMGQNSVEKLGDARIVPVVRQSTSNRHTNEKHIDHGDLQYLAARACYIGSSPTYGEIFDFVDFGSEANAFLLRCGSKHEPTKFEIAAAACKEPARLLGIMQSPEKYQSLLRTLADDLPTLKRDGALFKQMKQSKFLLGFTEIPATKENRKSFMDEASNFMTKAPNSDDDDTEDAPIKQWKLAAANEILIIDDYISYRHFKGSLLCAPMDDKLEDFYLALGASSLGGIVQDDLKLGRPSGKQESAVKLRAHVLERSKLFLHEYDRKSIKHDSRWLDKNLNVQVVSSISLKRSLRGYNLSHTEKRSAACTKDSRSGWTLYVIGGDYDVYQLSQAICKLLLDRPNQQANLTFETFLKLNLVELRSRGYNVERILRAKAAEQRIAEEERKKQLEAEQGKIREQEEEWKRKGQSTSGPSGGGYQEPEDSMPGTFRSDPPDDLPAPPPKPKSRGLFSSLGRRLGFENNIDSEPQKELGNFLGSGPVHGPSVNDPPPYDEHNQERITKPQGQITKPGGGSERVTSPATLQQNLLNAIKSSRGHDSSVLFAPPSTSIIKEDSSYCDSSSEQNITFLAETSNGMRIFVSKSMLMLHSDFLSANLLALNSFAALLHDLADVYNLPHAALHIFYDEEGSTIAFNLNGSIFCNFRFFSQLHASGILNGDHQEMASGRLEAGSYWWTVLAHELAHNIIKPHGAEHSFYSEMFTATYLPRMMAKSAPLFMTSISTPEPDRPPGVERPEEKGDHRIVP